MNKPKCSCSCDSGAGREAFNRQIVPIKPSCARVGRKLRVKTSLLGEVILTFEQLSGAGESVPGQGNSSFKGQETWRRVQGGVNAKERKSVRATGGEAPGSRPPEHASYPASDEKT